jgi:hypothetical protein
VLYLKLNLCCWSLQTFVSYQLVKSARVPETTAGEIPVICDFEDIDAETKLTGMRRTLRLQTVCGALFFVAFLLYLPVGLSVVQPFKRLTIDQVSCDFAPALVRLLDGCVLCVAVFGAQPWGRLLLYHDEA